MEGRGVGAVKSKVLYFLRSMWLYNWKATVKLSLMWLVASIVAEDIVHGWYDIDWLVVIFGFAAIFLIRLIVPAVYYEFSDGELAVPLNVKSEIYKDDLETLEEICRTMRKDLDRVDHDQAETWLKAWPEIFEEEK